MKREIVYATYNSQGLNVKNPYIIQGKSHITDLTEHLWKKTVTGHMMRVALEHLRIELGENIDILRSNWNQHKNQLLTSSWMTETWRFMSESGVTLEDKTQKIQLLRIKDKIIMEEFRKNKMIKSNELKVLNKCRLYLKIFTLSDITSGDGKSIVSKAWTGK